jgi:hypothetical protein
MQPQALLYLGKLFFNVAFLNKKTLRRSLLNHMKLFTIHLYRRAALKPLVVQIAILLPLVTCMNKEITSKNSIIYHTNNYVFDDNPLFAEKVEYIYPNLFDLYTRSEVDIDLEQI